MIRSANQSGVDRPLAVLVLFRMGALLLLLDDLGEESPLKAPCIAEVALDSRCMRVLSSLSGSERSMPGRNFQGNSFRGGASRWPRWGRNNEEQVTVKGQKNNEN